MRFKNTHCWNLNPKEAIKLQDRLKRKIQIKKMAVSPRLIAAADVAFRRGTATAAAVVINYPELKVIESMRETAKISYPYIPGLLTFREGPVLEKCFKHLKNKPDIIIFDGQGLAHPRSMGIATHMGIILNKPTIGCAKTRLYGKCTEPGKERGAFSYLFDERGKKIGAVLRTRSNVKPVYVSVGNKIDLDSCIKVILSCAKKYRIPEPIRLAHQLCSHA